MRSDANYLDKLVNHKDKDRDRGGASGASSGGGSGSRSHSTKGDLPKVLARNSVCRVYQFLKDGSKTHSVLFNSHASTEVWNSSKFMAMKVKDRVGICTGQGGPTFRRFYKKFASSLQSTIC